MNDKCLYLFLDEGGNFDFSNKGSQYFSLSCVTTQRPFLFYSALNQYRYDCIEFGLSTEHFHASHDNYHVKKNVFNIIEEHVFALHIDSLLVKKSGASHTLHEPKNLYIKIFENLIYHVINDNKHLSYSEIIIITDNLPINKKRASLEKSIKLILAEMLPEGTCYRILHHASTAHYGLQIADYCNWAILRKWEKGDDTYYRKIKQALGREATYSNEECDLFDYSI